MTQPPRNGEDRLRLRVKDWKEFQHYRDRKPPWIKVHREQVLDNYDWSCLPDASAALALPLWMLASEYQDGVINSTVQEVAFRVRRSIELFDSALNPLISAGFFILEHDASNPMPERQRSALSESEGEQETEGEREASRRKPRPAPQEASVPLPPDWLPSEDAIAEAMKQSPHLSKTVIYQQTKKFTQYAQSKAWRCVDWTARWLAWMSDSKDKAPESFIGEGKKSPSLPPIRLSGRDGPWRVWMSSYRPGDPWNEKKRGPRPESTETNNAIPDTARREWRTAHGLPPIGPATGAGA